MKVLILIFSFSLLMISTNPRAEDCHDLLAGGGSYLGQIQWRIHKIKQTCTATNLKDFADLGEDIVLLQTMLKYPKDLKTTTDKETYTQTYAAVKFLFPYAALVNRFQEVKTKYEQLERKFHTISLSNPEKMTMQGLNSACRALRQQEYATDKEINNLKYDIVDIWGHTGLSPQAADEQFKALKLIMPHDEAFEFWHNVQERMNQLRTTLNQWQQRIIIMKDATEANLQNLEAYLRAYPEE